MKRLMGWICVVSMLFSGAPVHALKNTSTSQSAPVSSRNSSALKGTPLEDKNNNLLPENCENDACMIQAEHPFSLAKDNFVNELLAEEEEDEGYFSDTSSKKEEDEEGNESSVSRPSQTLTSQVESHQNHGTTSSLTVSQNNRNRDLTNLSLPSYLSSETSREPQAFVTNKTPSFSGTFENVSPEMVQVTQAAEARLVPQKRAVFSTLRDFSPQETFQPKRSEVQNFVTEKRSGPQDSAIPRLNNVFHKSHTQTDSQPQSQGKRNMQPPSQSQGSLGIAKSILSSLPKPTTLERDTLAENLALALANREKELSGQSSNHEAEEDSSDGDSLIDTEYDSDNEEWDEYWDDADQSDGHDEENVLGHDEGWLMDEVGRQYQDSKGERWYYDPKREERYLERGGEKVYLAHNDRYYIDGENGEKLYYVSASNEWIKDVPADSRNEFLKSIQLGVSLKKVEVPSERPQDERSRVLKSIRGGIKLKKVDLNKPHPNQKSNTAEDSSKKAEGEKKEGGTIQTPPSHLEGGWAQVSNMISEDSSSDEDDTDDEDIWGEKPIGVTVQDNETEDKPEEGLSLEQKEKIEWEKLKSSWKKSEPTSNEKAPPLSHIQEKAEIFDGTIKTRKSPSSHTSGAQAGNFPPKVYDRKLWNTVTTIPEIEIIEKEGILFATENASGLLEMKNDSTETITGESESFINSESTKTKGTADSNDRDMSTYNLDPVSISDLSQTPHIDNAYDSHEIAVQESQAYDAAVAAYYGGTLSRQPSTQ